jgi:hypothetical protein
VRASQVSQASAAERWKDQFDVELELERSSMTGAFTDGSLAQAGHWCLGMGKKVGVEYEGYSCRCNFAGLLFWLSWRY